jgi:PEP-CTERM motif
MRTRWISWAAVLSFVCGSPAIGMATPITYNFTLIAASPAFVFNSNMFPTINAGGTVAFEALLPTGIERIFTGDDGAISTIATNGSGSPFAFFGPGLGAGPAISADGTVAFSAVLNAGGEGIFVGNGGPITTIADTSGPFGGLSGVAISNNGTVAFQAELRAGGTRILASRDGLLTTIAHADDFSFGTTSVNDGGSVAFATNPIRPGSGLFVGSGGPLTTIANTSAQGPFFQIGEPSINAGETVAFHAFLVNDGTLAGNGIFTGNGAPIMAIADDSGSLCCLSAPSINGQGTVAFRAGVDSGGVGIFVGPDLMSDRVIVTGDLLFGSEVRTLDFGGGQALNDAGQLVFRAGLADGRAVLVRADPSVVPEPATLLLVATGFLGVLGHARGTRVGQSGR